MVLFDDTRYHFFVNGEDKPPVSYHLRAFGDPQRPAFVVTEFPDNEGPSLAEATPALVFDLIQNTETIYKVPQNLPDLLWFEQDLEGKFEQAKFVSVEVSGEPVVHEGRAPVSQEAVLAQLGLEYLPIPDLPNDFSGQEQGYGVGNLSF